MVARLHNSFPRPSRPLYQGSTDIIVGVSFGLEPPVAVAIIEATTGKMVLYQSIRQLLGENYKLLSHYRHQQKQHSNQRHKNQGKGQSDSITESNSGEYRLFRDLYATSDAFKFSRLSPVKWAKKCSV